jgi:type I restriction enzyme S subunit
MARTCNNYALKVATEIVRRLEAFFALADQIEARFAQARAQVDRLTPSPPRPCFRGQLISEDTTDESVKKLLERIKADGEARAKR